MKARRLLAGALGCAVLHAAFSIYWGLGGTWLLETVGQFAVDMQARGQLTDRIMLLSIGAFKLAAGVVPYRYPHVRWVRLASWLGASIMLTWGALGVMWGLVGLLTPSDARNIPAFIGHVFVWDPLFVVWAVLLMLGLRYTRQ